MIKTALILDNGSLTRWQMNALTEAARQIDICLVLSCNNTRQKKSYRRHFLYYVLNALTLRNKLTARLQYSAQAETIQFNSVYDGGWQKLPADVIDELIKHDVKLVIKFGMGLLRVEGALADLAIFSFHHGDPSEFRGRPAGFYELLFRKESVGTIVQTISNKLDAGKVWAICHSKVNHHSYKQTALRFYENSRYLLNKAITNYALGAPVDVVPNGVIYRLPGNAVVLRFLLMLAVRKISRLLYGMFWEKRWNIVVFDNDGRLLKQKLRVRDGKTPTISSGYNFLADPFFSADGNRIRVEALNSSSGLGEIVELDRATLQPTDVLLAGSHYSYPFSLVDQDVEYLLPEIASHSSPMLFRRQRDGFARIPLKGLEGLRILDGTIFRHGDNYFLFGGLMETAENCLYLFVSSSLDEVFHPHPANPIVIDPRRARMAGRIVRFGDRLVRFGQNNTFQYGNGLYACEIVELSAETYEEKILHEVRFEDACGPHTVDMTMGRIVLDHYAEAFSLLAGYRRLVPRILKAIGAR